MVPDFRLFRSAWHADLKVMTSGNSRAKRGDMGAKEGNFKSSTIGIINSQFARGLPPSRSGPRRLSTNPHRETKSQKFRFRMFPDLQLAEVRIRISGQVNPKSEFDDLVSLLGLVVVSRVWG